VHDKVVRRRRAVLALLVLISLVLLTAYFGESPSSPLHTVQRGIVAAVSPIEDGASKALSPVRDVSDWVSTTLRAKTENRQLRTEVGSLTTRLAESQQKAIDEPQLAHELKLNQDIGISAYDPVSASVIYRDPSVWYQQVFVNRGSSSGVRDGDAVLSDGALVGKVLEVTGPTSEVQLITDHSYEVAGEAQDGQGDTGILSPVLGNNLVLQDLAHDAPIQTDDLVVTAGFKNPTDLSQSGSLYPSAIPIGVVSSFSQNELLNNGEVPVTPIASIRRFTSVQILTRSVAGQEAADIR
jgi:rod shape-determining protein MreC